LTGFLSDTIASIPTGPLTPDQTLYLAAIVRRFPRYGSDLFNYHDIPPSTIKPGMTDAESKKAL
jgi:hypothetical protein